MPAPLIGLAARVAASAVGGAIGGMFGNDDKNESRKDSFSQGQQDALTEDRLKYAMTSEVRSAKGG
jgi:hypothetical protein